MINELALLGSTGSVGRQSLEVAESLGIRITALCANKNVKTLEEQARRVRPEIAAAFEPEAARELKTALADTPTRVLSGPEGLVEAALSSSCVLQAMSGTRGIIPTLEAINNRARICLANKETLVCAGGPVMRAAAQSGAEIVPVDSEHSAIFQCLEGRREQLRKILLTASGGPFRGKKRRELSGMMATDALRHPTWSMGAKITVDSATMMNKGLEYIEAMYLFGASPGQIEVIVHPQSVVHSMVELSDGAVLAQMGAPDMRLPIQYALTYPERRECIAAPLDLGVFSKLEFEAPDMETFRLLPLAIEAAERGGVVPAVMNGANEAAVELFLKGRIDWFGLEKLVLDAVREAPDISAPPLEDILACGDEARRAVFMKGHACI